MADQNLSNYAPRSPDLSAYHADTPQPRQQIYQPSQPSLYPPSFIPPDQTHSLPQYQDQYPSQFSLNSPQSYLPEQSHHSGGRKLGMDDDWAPESSSKTPGRKSKKQKVEPDYGTKPAPGVEEGIEVKTKFPVARIKRIMQADEDVGKVAQVTPTAVCTCPGRSFSGMSNFSNSESS
jgi:hypothetical protein